MNHLLRWRLGQSKCFRLLQVSILFYEIAVAIVVPAVVCACVEETDSKGELALLSEVVDIAVGEAHSCALRRDGTVACWGYNAMGQLGSYPDQDTLEAMDPVGITIGNKRGYNPHASIVEGLSDVQQIAAGANHTCAIVADGTVRCWGDSSAGQLGNGDFSLDECERRPCSRRPVKVKGLKQVVALSLGQQHSCALQKDGQLSCWGRIAVGIGSNQLDSCDQIPCATSPIDVPLEEEVVQVMAGYRHSCALLESGSVACWGQNTRGQVGASNAPREYVGDIEILSSIDKPMELSLPESADQVAFDGSVITFSHKSCAGLVDGSLYCWGQDEWGQLGVGEPEETNCWTTLNTRIPCAKEPRKVQLDIEVEKFLWAEYTGCALERDGTMHCWGRNDSAQLGVDTQADDQCYSGSRCSRFPITIPTSKRVLDGALGKIYSCVLQEDLRIACWGWGFPPDNDDDPKKIDCSSSQDPCLVESSWQGRPQRLVFTHFDTFCVLTQAGQVHCLGNFKPDSHSITSEPVRVYR